MRWYFALEKRYRFTAPDLAKEVIGKSWPLTKMHGNATPQIRKGKIAETVAAIDRT